MSGSKDFRHTRIRGVFGSRDIWFPPGKSSSQMRTIKGKYKLKDIGAETVTADHTMADYNAGVATTIYEAIKTEIRAVIDFKENPVLPYDEECCSDDFKNNCNNFGECVLNVNKNCWDSTSK